MLTIRPITLREANAYVAAHHRHNQPTRGHKWSLALYDNERLCGVAIAGQPIARKLDDGLTIEVRRLCTDGTKDACSKLYGACARVAKEMAYRKIITYTLISEPGTSLRASGWTNCGEAGGVSWNMPSRPREVEQITMFGTVRKYPDEKKIRWEKILEEMIAKITVELAERGWPGKVDHVAVKDKRNGGRLMLLDVRKQRQISMAQPITLEITAGVRGVWHFLNKEEISNGVVELWTQDRKIFPARTTIEDVYGNWSAEFIGSETE